MSDSYRPLDRVGEDDGHAIRSTDGQPDAAIAGDECVASAQLAGLAAHLENIGGVDLR